VSRPVSPLQNVARAAANLATATRAFADAMAELARSEGAAPAPTKPTPKARAAKVAVSADDLEAARASLRRAGAKGL